MGDEEQRKKKIQQARRLKMHREILTKDFTMAFKVWCACHPGCRHCQFVKYYAHGGCVELYYKWYYRPLFTCDDELPF